MRVRQTRIEDLEIIKTLDGVKDITGSTFLAEMGELSNFKSYKSLIAYMGFDPSTHQSREACGAKQNIKTGESAYEAHQPYNDTRFNKS